MFIVKLSGSRFFKSDHYLAIDRGFRVVQRSKARAARLTREQAEQIAASWRDPNGFSATVVEA